MTPLLKKYGNIVLTTTTIHRVRYHLCLLLIVRLGGYIANLSDFYSYRFIGKLTVFLQLQEFSLREEILDHQSFLFFEKNLFFKTFLSGSRFTCYNNKSQSHNLPVASSTSAARLSHIAQKLTWFSVAKTTVLRINLNLDGTPISSKSHTHPSHSQTSRLLTSSLSLGIPVPRPTQCV